MIGSGMGITSVELLVSNNLTQHETRDTKEEADIVLRPETYREKTVTMETKAGVGCEHHETQREGLWARHEGVDGWNRSNVWDLVRVQGGAGIGDKTPGTDLSS